MAIVLLDQQGNAQEFLDQQSADQALAAGTHSIPMVGPDGQPAGVPAVDRDSALHKGFALPSTQQLQSLVDASKFGSTGQAVAAGLEGAAETATLGLSGAAEQALGVDPEGVRKRAEQNPVAHGIGEVVGTVAPVLVGDEAGALNVLGKVGEAGEAAAKALTTEGSLASKIAGWAGRGAAETGLLETEHALNESILGDPDATAEHVLADVGMAAVLGGAGGAILGKASESGHSLATKLFDREGSLFKNLTKLKDNSKDIESAAERLGVNLQPGQLSASKSLQDLNSQLAKEPTVVGTKVQAQVDEQFDKIRGALSESLGGGTALTKEEVNQALMDGIQSKVDEIYAPLREGFATLKQRNVDIPVDKEEMARIAELVPKIESAHKRPGSVEASFTKRISENLPLQETVDDLRKLRTSAGAEAFNPSRGSELWHYGNVVKEHLDALEDKSVNQALIKAVQEGKISQEEARHLVYLNASTKEGYSTLRGDLEKLAKIFGKNKVGGVEHFFSILQDKANSGTLANKLFAKENSKFLKFFKERFPEQAELLARYQKSTIAEKAFEDGTIRPGKVLAEIDKLEPEVQRFLFSKDDLRRIEDAKTLLDAMPDDINPSGTSKAKTWGEALNPFRHGTGTLAGEMIGGPVGAVAGYAASVAGPEISSMLKKSLLKGLVSGTPVEIARHEALSKLMDRSQKTAKLVARAAKAVFLKGASEKVTRMSRSERDSVSKKISDYAREPQKLVERVSKLSEGMAEHAPSATSSLSQAVGRAGMFLYAKMPKETQASPFSPKLEPSEFQKAEFQRYAQAVLDPVSVMSRIHDASLNHRDVEALQAVYPKLYQSMRDAVASAMADAVTRKAEVPYATRLGVSMFLGEPIDRSLAPNSILTAQAMLQGAAAGAAAADLQQEAKVKHSAAPLAKSAPRYATPGQAAAARHSETR